MPTSTTGSAALGQQRHADAEHEHPERRPAALADAPDECGRGSAPATAPTPWTASSTPTKLGSRPSPRPATSNVSVSEKPITSSATPDATVTWRSGMVLRRWRAPAGDPAPGARRCAAPELGSTDPHLAQQPGGDRERRRIEQRHRGAAERGVHGGAGQRREQPQRLARGLQHPLASPSSSSGSIVASKPERPAPSTVKENPYASVTA